VRGPITEDQREDLQRIRRNQRHLLGLINDILNFAKLEAGHVEVVLADVPIDDVLLDIEALIAPQVHSKALEYVYQRCDPSLIVRADREKLEQVVLNLVSTAVKFTAPGGRIELAATGDDHQVSVRVCDTGCGIPAEKLEQIFDPFVRLEAGLTSTVDGTGLGLSISRDLARMMGGTLTATSVPDRGSVFTLTVPRATR
jgi:signal transduction histidine kinase